MEGRRPLGGAPNDPEPIDGPEVRAIASALARWYDATPPAGDERRRLLARMREGAEAGVGTAVASSRRARAVAPAPVRFRLAAHAAAAALLLAVAGIAGIAGRAVAPGPRADVTSPPAVAERASAQAVGFSLQLPDADVRQVALAGDFNGWSPTALPMQRDPSTGTWRAHVRLGPGRHEYSFVVNGTRWIIDPLAPRTMEHELGAANVIAVPGDL